MNFDHSDILAAEIVDLVDKYLDRALAGGACKADLTCALGTATSILTAGVMATFADQVTTFEIWCDMVRTAGEEPEVKTLAAKLEGA